MKTHLAFLLLFCMLPTLASASTLRFSIRGQGSTLINEPAISCSSRLTSIRQNKPPLKDVPALHFSLIDPRITFETETPGQYALISALQVRIDSPEIVGNAHQCLFESIELASTFGMGTDYSWSGNISANDTISINPTCFAMVCGGMKLKNPNSAGFTGKLTVRLIGLIKNSQTQEERPIQSESSNPNFRFSR